MRSLLVAALVFGSSLTPRPLKERAKLADRVAVVQVLSQRVELREGDVKQMFTHTEVLVGEVLKGPLATAGLDRITITQLGGRYGLWEAHVPGDTTFVPGETALVLLKCSPTPNQCGLYGLAEGKVQLVGNDAFVFDLASNTHARRPVAEVLNEVRSALAPPPAPTGVKR